MSTRTTIKQHIPVFSSKFDSDFNSFKMTARAKCRTGKVDVRTDIPIYYVIANLPQTYESDETLVIEIGVSY